MKFSGSFRYNETNYKGTHGHNCRKTATQSYGSKRRHDLQKDQPPQDRRTAEVRDLESGFPLGSPTLRGICVPGTLKKEFERAVPAATRDPGRVTRPPIFQGTLSILVEINMTAFILISIGIIWALISAAILLSVAIHSSKISQAEEMAAQRPALSLEGRRAEAQFESAGRAQSVDVAR